MPKLRNKKHELFCQEYLVDLILLPNINSSIIHKEVI